MTTTLMNGTDISTLVDGGAITDPMDPRLDAFRPDPSIVDEYVSRKLPGGKGDIDTMLKYWEERRNVMLVGDTQSGKTMLVQVLAVIAAKKAGLPKPYPVFTLSGSAGITDFDLFGQNSVWVDPVTGEERLVYLPGVVALAAAVESFLYLDEITMMEDRVTSSLLPVCDERRTFINRQKAVKVPGDGFMPEIVKVNPGTWIIGTYNVGYRGAAPLQEAFANRFKHLRWDYDEAVEEILFKYQSVRALAKAIRNSRASGQITTPCGVKALMDLERDVEEFSVEYGVWAFIGLFPPREQEKINHLFDAHSITSLLVDEVETTKMYAEEKS